MNIEEATANYQNAILVSVDVVPNTSKQGEWVLLMKDKDGKSYFLINQLENI